jgi:5'-3' exonuclease
MSKTFEKFQETENCLLVIDALNLAFRYKHSGATDFAEDYIKTVKSLAKSYKASNVVIAADQGSSSYRKNLYPQYKQNRKDKFEQQTPAEKQQFELFFEEFTATLEYIKNNTDFYLLRFPGVEADDICAYITNVIRNRPIWLISSDKDYDLLIKNNVNRFSYVTRKEITIDNWHEHYEFDPEDYISIKCLTGDAGDNVLGVPGIGPKRALALVREYGSCWDIVASLPILDKKYKYIQDLNKSKDLLLLNFQLMDLQTYCTEALGQENIAKINETISLLK